MKVKDLIKISSYINNFNIINSVGNPVGSFNSASIAGNTEDYVKYKDKLIKCITIPTNQAIPTLNIEIKPDRKRKQAHEEAKATIGVVSNTTSITSENLNNNNIIQ